MLSGKFQRFFSSSISNPFEFAAGCFLMTIVITHFQWIFKLYWGFTWLREAAFLLSLLYAILGVSLIGGNRRTSRILVSSFILGGVVIFSYSVDRLIFDLSPDTLTTHYELARFIAVGVHPYFEASAEGSLDEYSVLGVTFHLMASISFRLGLTRNPFILPHLHMILLSCAGVIAVMRKYRKEKQPALIALLPVLAFPTLSQQFLTGYRDGYSGLAIVSCIAIIFLAWSRQTVHTLTLTLGLIFSACLPSIKLSLIPIAVLLAAICVFGITSHHGVRYWLHRRTLLLLGLAGLLWTFPSLFILATSNETSRSLLSYEAAVATWSGSSPRLLSMGILEELGTLMFGIVQTNPSDITWSLPFQLPSSEEILVSGRPDPRVAGFGPWFGEAFTLAVLAAAFSTLAVWHRLRNTVTVTPGTIDGSVCEVHRRLCWTIVVITIVSFFATPFRFNARYAVVVYVLVLVLLWLAFTSVSGVVRQPRYLQFLLFASIGFLVVNSAICWYSAARVMADDRRLFLELIDNYNDRVDGRVPGREYVIVTGGKTGIHRYLPTQTPEGRPVNVGSACIVETQTRVYWLGDDIGICEGTEAG